MFGCGRNLAFNGRISVQLRLAVALLVTLSGASGCNSARSQPEGAQEAAPTGSVVSPIRVRVAVVRSARLTLDQEWTGVVFPNRQATVAAEAAGRVIKRAVERGDSARRGQLLFLLDASRSALERKRAAASLKGGEADLAQAKLDFARAEKLFASGAISRAERDRAALLNERARHAVAAARAAYRSVNRAVGDSVIKAPFAGTIAALHAEVGDFLGPGRPVATIVAMKQVRIRIGLSAAQSDRLEVGDRAVARFADLGGLERSGVLKSISPLADPTSGTYTAELLVDNPQGRLRQGMTCTVGVQQDNGRLGPVIPRAALVKRDGQTSVFVVEKRDGVVRARRAQVRLGRQTQVDVEVLSGLRSGERVVTTGMFALRDGAPVVVDDVSGSGKPAAGPSSKPSSRSSGKPAGSSPGSTVSKPAH